MIRLRSCSVLALSLSFLLGCDSGAKDDNKKDAAAKQPEATKQAETVEPEPATPEAKHFDIEQDKSGILARTAGVLETAGVHDENLAELSHHAEKLPSDEEVCKHIAEVRKDASPDLAACVKEAEHHVVKLGPELYALAVSCLMDATTPAELDVCVEAEREAELLLHEKPHGEGLDEATCDALFTQFETLAMADAGENAELVKEVLEETRADVVATCIDQGTKAEAECAMSSKTLAELKDCASKML